MKIGSISTVLLLVFIGTISPIVPTSSASELEEKVSARESRKERDDFNKYVLMAVEKIYAERKLGGYHLGSYYTQDLKYGGMTVFAYPKRSPSDEWPRRTQCVGTMGEVMIEAINLYEAEQEGERAGRVYKKMPASTWMKADLQSFLPYLHMHQDSRDVYKYGVGETPSVIKNGRRVAALSRGTGHAMSIFRIGEERKFSDLKKGDFVNFNRPSGSGHAVVFLAYIGKDNSYTQVFSKDVIGFHYFSAQGKGRTDAGLGYRDAYFGKHSGPTAGGFVKDTAIRSSDLLYLNGGRLWAPELWDVKQAIDDVRDRVANAVPRRTPKRSAVISELLTLEMPMSSTNFSGEEE